MKDEIDILMITYNRAAYTRLALSRLLQTCEANMRVWIWHNGDDQETLDLVRAMAHHPRVYRFHHSQENKKLREPTNWFWSQSTAAYICKVDDDCLMPDGWGEVLRQAHRDVADLGVVGCWRFPDEDFLPEAAAKKIKRLPGDHKILQNCWIEGSGYLMKRECYGALGPLTIGQSFTDYCIQLALRGWTNGWYYPFLYQEHMDDPRAQHTLLKSDADLLRYMPLSAKTFGAASLREWTDALRRDAHCVQTASVDPRHYVGWRAKLRGLIGRLRPADRHV